MAKPNKGLGRGLDALLTGGRSEKDDVLKELNVTMLKPGKYQPRSHMDAASLNELAASIKAQGVMQPILVRQLSDGGYEIIAGERRWRAAQLAGLSHVPVLVRSVTDNAALAMALIENIQREDLNPLEEAVGIQRLIDEFKMTHQAAADAVGRSRSAASNLLRLLKLPQAVQTLLMEGKLDMGHARALLSLEGAQQITTANQVAIEQLSVRETEELVNGLVAGDIKTKTQVKTKKLDRDAFRLQESLSSQLGTKVEIKAAKNGSGKLIVVYQSNDHLSGLLEKLKLSN
ncbi:MAG: ParB/RepB/Spo0J family partition protein [Gallionella sp.]|nr:ParB/RepB/Spo0J family partition protein [Gallionella sp.]